MSITYRLFVNSMLIIDQAYILYTVLYKFVLNIEYPFLNLYNCVV